MWSEAGSGGWSFFEVAADQEPANIAALDAQGITAIAWSNAVVDLSNFGAIDSVPLSTLDQRLTSDDPRWDPWLTGLKKDFLPRSGTARMWVEGSRYEEARKIVGSLESGPLAPVILSIPPGGLNPRTVTGWMVVMFSLLYFIFRLAGEIGNGWGGPPRRWLWLPLTLTVSVAGATLALSSGSPVTLAAPPAAQASQSWLRHRWFQESLPYGATWKDWVPGKAWTYRSYSQENGRLTEVSTPVVTPDAPWAQAVYQGLDRHHAARIFGLENP